jgi:MerR family transcriptional regulator, copper efflux regulator
MQAQPKIRATSFGIGELSRQSGVAVPNIRYYESVGLLPRAARRSGGQRDYDADAMRQLAFVKGCRELGFSLIDVRELLFLSKSENRTCDAARDLAARQLGAVRRKQAELQLLEAELARQVDDCDAACAGGPASGCTIFSGLSDTGVSPKRAPGCG